MVHQSYPHLFSPIVLGNTVFRNRIFASPTGYQNINGTGFLNAGAAAYYERKAQGGCASVCSFEGVVDGELGKGGDRHICLDTPNIDIELARIAHAVSIHGAVASLELQHTGMYANRMPAFMGAESRGIAYGPVEGEVEGRHVGAFDEEIMNRTLGKYRAAGELARRAGFGMVTIHAAHGWMLHQFLSPSTNTRTDRYGGSVENRTRFVKEVCEAVRAGVGAGFPIEIRLSGSECYPEGYQIDEGIAIAEQLDDSVDLLHISAGIHELLEVFAITHPCMFLPDGVNVQYAAAIKPHVKTPVATVGALGDADLMEEIIATGKADVVELARALLADPDLPKKIRTGNGQTVRRCMRCLSCFSAEMTHGEPYCAINPESGRELEMRLSVPPATKKKVLVVGGGIAGMQAASGAAERGHEVILCERSGRLGGVLLCEEEVSFKQKLAFYLAQQARRVAAADVEVRLNTEVDAAYANSIGADVLIAALGATPIKPAISGIDGEGVLSAQDAYLAADELPERVLILGAGLVGVELGLHLIEKGRQVTILEMTDHINDGGNFLHMPGLLTRIRELGLDIRYGARVTELQPAAAIYEQEGAQHEILADCMVYAVGQRPRRDESLALALSAPDFYLIGDCRAPRNITEANAEGFFIARDIGVPV
ncbi:MAG: FAD-dependent oxidoreductase [Coriobacteriales bacterium]|nr:FAD-dependent oxidoreductase [Coriobacteriales bacterium]